MPIKVEPVLRFWRERRLDCLLLRKRFARAGFRVDQVVVGVARIAVAQSAVGAIVETDCITPINRGRDVFHSLIGELDKFLFLHVIDRSIRLVSILFGANLLNRLDEIVLPVPQINQHLLVVEGFFVGIFLGLGRRS